MTVEIFSVFVGMVISFVFRFAPILKEKYYMLTDKVQQLVMAVVLVVVAIVVYALECLLNPPIDVPTIALVCGKDGIRQFIVILVSMIVGNQSLYPLIKE